MPTPRVVVHVALIETRLSELHPKIGTEPSLKATEPSGGDPVGLKNAESVAVRVIDWPAVGEAWLEVTSTLVASGEGTIETVVEDEPE